MRQVKPTRRVLPGGATLGGSSLVGDERSVACRPQAAVLERTRRLPWLDRVKRRLKAVVDCLLQKNTLGYIKLLLGVLAALVGLIGAILALFGWPRK